MRRQFIEASAKHLPPSASDLRLLDINGESGEILRELRQNITPIAVTGDSREWQLDDSSVDGVIALDYVLSDLFLQRVLAVLRPGGRIIVVQSKGEVKESIGRRLEANGYVRILVEKTEAGSPCVLIRGEKPHQTTNTLDRIATVANHDPNQLDFARFKGRYVHLLIVQTPDKPTWRLEPDDEIEWQAVAVLSQNQLTLLAFSSLPKAVGFMQPAVLAGKIRGVNKVGKFTKETAITWQHPVIVNPNQEILKTTQVIFVPVDAMTAEVSDE